MSRIWFAAKKYGYGWYPSTWQGWLILVGFLALIYTPLGIFGPEAKEGAFAAFYIPYALILVCILLIICVRTGEEPRWRWGGK